MARSLKGLHAAATRSMLRRWLRHRVTVVPAGQSSRYGTPVDGTAFSTACLIQGSRSRVVDQDHNTVQTTHSITFPPDVAIKVGDHLKDGTDRAGESLLTRGTVVHVQDDDHPIEGTKSITVSVAEN